MEGIISDELEIDLNTKRVNEDHLKEILSCCGNVDMMFNSDKKIVVVKFQNKDHVIRTLKTRLISYNFNGLWKSLPPKSEILTDDSPIGDLPVDCLVKIFSFLSIDEKLMIERVCKRWRDIGLQGWPSLKSLKISSELNKFTSSQLMQIFGRCGRFLKVLTILVIDEETNCLPLVKYYCLQLRELTVDFNYKAFSKLQIFCNNLSEIFAECDKLTSVNIWGIHSNFNYECLEKLSKNRMRQLCLHVPSSNHGTHLHLNLHEFNSLEKLELKGFIIDEKKFLGLENLTELISLNFVNSHVHVNHVREIRNLIKLEQLSLENIISEICDDNFLEITKNCRNLKSLNINNLDRLTDRCFEEISRLQRLERLEMMGLTQVTNSGLIRLIKQAPSLSKLWVDGPLITEDFLTDVNALMQCRTSGVELHLHLHSDAEDWEQPLNLSPLLTLTYTW